MDHLRTFRKNELKFNLESAVQSSLSEDLQGCDMVIQFHFRNCFSDTYRLVQGIGIGCSIPSTLAKEIEMFLIFLFIFSTSCLNIILNISISTV